MSCQPSRARKRSHSSSADTSRLETETSCLGRLGAGTSVGEEGETMSGEEVGVTWTVVVLPEGEGSLLVGLVAKLDLGRRLRGGGGVVAWVGVVAGGGGDLRV